MKFKTLRRLAVDARGLETIDIALAIGLFAFVAGSGLFYLGDSLARYFTGLADEFRVAQASPLGSTDDDDAETTDPDAPASGTSGDDSGSAEEDDDRESDDRDDDRDEDRDDDRDEDRDEDRDDDDDDDDDEDRRDNRGGNGKGRWNR